MKKIVNSHCFKLVISAIFAGFIMAMAAFELVAAKSLNMYYIGGFVQGFGLLGCLFLGLELYNTKLISIFTSKNKWWTLLDLLIVLVTNILTIVFVAWLCRIMTLGNTKLIDAAKDIATYRVIGGTGKEWYDALIASLLCGFIVSVGVNIYKRVDNPIAKCLTIILAVGTYVVCGFEQIMTNTFYILFADLFNGSTCIDLLIVLLGNSIAAIIVYFAFKLILPTNKINKK